MKNLIDQVQVLEMMSEGAIQIRREGHDVYSREEVATMFERLHTQIEELQVEKDAVQSEKVARMVDETIESVKQAAIETLDEMDYEDEYISVNLNDREIKIEFSEKLFIRDFKQELQERINNFAG